MMRTEALRIALLLALALAPAAAATERAAAAAEPQPTAGGAERSLEAITIEGVAKGPEVLFINAREPARVELRLGWQLIAAAGLLEPAPPPQLALRAAALPTSRPAAQDPGPNPVVEE